LKIRCLRAADTAGAGTGGRSAYADTPGTGANGGDDRAVALGEYHLRLALRVTTHHLEQRGYRVERIVIAMNGSLPDGGSFTANLAG
jgi:hypothetical protein